MKKLAILSVFIFLLNISAASAVETGAMCPVSGEKASAKLTHEFEGKTYSFCCPKCLKEFKKDPSKYLAAQTTQVN